MWVRRLLIHVLNVVRFSLPPTYRGDNDYIIRTVVRICQVSQPQIGEDRPQNGFHRKNKIKKPLC
jgi:hypothetical protein